MAALTISSLTLTGHKSDLVHSAGLHGEQELLAAAKCGDAAAFNELFQPIAKRTFQIVDRITKNREDAEDALQDSFLRALRHVKAFESRSRFSSWFTSIAINSALMILRKRRNSFEILTDGFGNSDAIRRYWEVADRAPNPEKRYFQRKRERILRRAIRALRPSPFDSRGRRDATVARALDEGNSADDGHLGRCRQGAAISRQGRAPQSLGPKSNRKSN